MEQVEKTSYKPLRFWKMDDLMEKAMTHNLMQSLAHTRTGTVDKTKLSEDDWSYQQLSAFSLIR